MEILNEKIDIKEELNTREKMIIEATKNLEDPFSNLTVSEVAKDLKMGENLANQIFRRPDFPSVNLGKTKTVTRLAYIIWKMERRV